jgi:hypothetical protein
VVLVCANDNNADQASRHTWAKATTFEIAGGIEHERGNLTARPAHERPLDQFWRSPAARKVR